MSTSKQGAPDEEASVGQAGSAPMDSTEAASGVQRVARPLPLSLGGGSLRVVYQCIAAAAASDSPTALRDDISEMLVVGAGYVASWFFEWQAKGGGPTTGAYQTLAESSGPVPPAYMEAVHQALGLKIGTPGKAQMVDFKAPAIAEKLSSQKGAGSQGLSRCVFLPLKVRDEISSGLVVCTDDAKLLDPSCASALGEVAIHVARRLGELRTLAEDSKTSKKVIATKGQSQGLSIIPIGSLSPGDRPTMRVGGRQRAHYLSVTIPESATEVSESGTPSLDPERKLSLEEALSVADDLNNQLSIIRNYSDSAHASTASPMVLTRDLQAIGSAGDQAEKLLGQLLRFLKG